MTEKSHSAGGASDLTFIMNEAGQSLRDRFAILLGKDTRFFDCLVGYFFISGFYRIYSALENVEKVRILVGLQTDRTAYDLLQHAKEQGELSLQSHASSKEQVAKDVLNELETSGDSVEIETGVHKFMKILMVKRMESSFHAFRLTLDRFTHSYARVITEFKKGNVYISKKHVGKIFDLLEQEKAERLSAKDFSAEFIVHLKADYRTLRRVKKMWANVRRDPKWIAFREVLRSEPHRRQGKPIIFTESQETAEYLAGRIRDEVEPKTLLFSGKSSEAEHRDAIVNFDANAFKPADDFRILVSTEVLSEGVNLHCSNVAINYDIPWNPTRLIQRVGRVNRVDTKFDAIRTYNFFPTDEGNDAIELREAVEAKIHAFIEMLGSDARLRTEGEEVKSFDLFAKLNSKKTITGEDEDEESELEYLTEIRTVRDKQPELFSRIKRLPRKARSTRTLPAAQDAVVQQFPSLLTYFRQGRLDKFYLAAQGTAPSIELAFLTTVKVLKPTDPNEARQAVPSDFYALLDRNKDAFATVTSREDEDAIPHHKGGANDAYILKRLKAKEVRRYHGYTDDDEEYIRNVIQLLIDGSLPKPTTKKVAEALKREIEPLKMVGILRRDISPLFFQSTRAQRTLHSLNPREVILSSWLMGGPEGGTHG